MAQQHRHNQLPNRANSDKVPSGANTKSLIAEIDPITGAMLNSFQIAALFSVNYGDIEVSTKTGNLFIVSSDETTIAEYTPTGTFVQKLALPTGVSNLSGIALDDTSGLAWVSSPGGIVWQISNIPLELKQLYLPLVVRN